MQGAGHLDHYGNGGGGGTVQGGDLKSNGLKKMVNDPFAEDKKNNTMDIRRKLDSTGSEDRTGKETHENQRYRRTATI